jgi:hypothetical protein
MRKIKLSDVKGKKFGRLVVIDESTAFNEKHSAFLCRCDCGNVLPVRWNHLGRLHTTSCGCRQRDVVSARETKHGMCRSKVYSVWSSMIQRCRSEKNSHWHRYGGRGIKVCQRWIDSLANFYADMGPRPSPKHTIDRINNDGNYEPGNCRWATHAENARNGTRAKITITIAKEIRLFKKSGARAEPIAKLFGISDACIYNVCSGNTWKEEASP